MPSNAFMLKVCVDPTSHSRTGHVRAFGTNTSRILEKLLAYFLTLQYCIGFAIYLNESTTGIHVLPILNPPPSSLPIPSLWVVPVHQPQASSIVVKSESYSLVTVYGVSHCSGLS